LARKVSWDGTDFGGRIEIATGAGSQEWPRVADNVERDECLGGTFSRCVNELKAA
jgi:hypothetical protein